MVEVKTKSKKSNVRWWDKLTPEQQKQYLKDHPHSLMKLGQHLETKSVDDRKMVQGRKSAFEKLHKYHRLTFGKGISAERNIAMLAKYTLQHKDPRVQAKAKAYLDNLGEFAYKIARDYGYIVPR